jgi:predicted short-subunit dehydrogenase-like oxidoreductase (DUF2520 family)
MNRQINIIGCGRAASSLARLWQEAGTISIGSILNQSETSSRNAARLIGAGQPSHSLEAMGPAEVWLIGTGDGQIGAMAKALADSEIELGRSLVFHLAGRFGLSVLAPLQSRAAALAALHPVRSLTFERLTLDEFRGTACVAEGAAEALKRLQPLVTGIGGSWLPVDRVDRGLYHASVAIISNITKAVAWKAQKWQVRAGLPEETAKAVTHQLLNSTMEDLFRSGARQSITGPVVRGDTSTIEAHLQALRSVHADDVDVYRVLARTVLELAQERGDLDETTLARFKELFRNQASGG